MDKRMLKQLNLRIKEAAHPVGIKRSSFIDLPPSDHVYGLLGKHDEEGAGIGK
jgi:hypothetical protein